MKKIIPQMAFVICTLVSASVSAQSDVGAPKSTHDGRMNTECNGANKFCLLSFYELFASIGYYNNKDISLKGYLVLDNGVLSLYPSEYSYQLGDSAASITFYIPASEQDKIAKRYAYSHVRIIGHFNAGDEGMDHIRLGVMDKIISILSIQLREAVGKREVPSVRLEDLDEKGKH